MSGKGNYLDNAQTESFWGILKNDLVYYQDYKTRQQGNKATRQPNADVYMILQARLALL